MAKTVSNFCEIIPSLKKLAAGKDLVKDGNLISNGHWAIVDHNKEINYDLARSRPNSANKFATALQVNDNPLEILSATLENLKPKNLVIKHDEQTHMFNYNYVVGLCKALGVDETKLSLVKLPDLCTENVILHISNLFFSAYIMPIKS